MTKKDDKKGTPPRSRKSTPRRKAEPSPAETSPTEASSVESPSAAASESAASEVSSAQPASGTVPKAKRTSLPAFGFAADLLKKKDEAPSDPEVAGSADDRGGSEIVAGAPGTPLADGPEERRDPEGDDVSPTRLFDFADQIAARTAREAEAAAPVRLETFVTFALANETFAMPVAPVRQIVRVSTITRVPHAPKPVRGVTNLRGRVIPVVDLRARVGLPPIEVDRSARVIAVSSKGRVLGLLVDAVHQVVHLDLNRVQPPPEDVMTLQSDYIEGVYGEGEELVLLLDVDRALILREAGAA